jgi:hypothetical protein
MEYCRVYEDFDDFYTILIIIPLTYFLVAIGILCYCCKYRRIRNQYQRLVEDNVDDPTRRNTQQLEMSGIKPELKENTL